MISEAKLDFWIKNNYNVLFIGRYGVGKTSIIKDAFDRAGLKWKYFSASTMDPWVDFIGVPKEVVSKDGNNVSYLDLIRPKEFQDDEVEALMFDEYNRGHKKIKNSVMELIQFKSINGKKFKNLRMVWAAINPDDDEEQTYDVEPLDPAQKDRFHIHVEIPYKPHVSYFRNKYGTNMASSALSWWHDLPKEIRTLVSPRRLDYALDIYGNDGDIRDVLPISSNPTKLIAAIQDAPIKEKLKEMFDSKNLNEATEFLANENNYTSAIQIIIGNRKYENFFIPVISDEKISTIISINKKAREAIIDLSMSNQRIKEIIKNIISAGQNKSLIKAFSKRISFIDDICSTQNTKGVNIFTPKSPYTNETTMDAVLKYLENDEQLTLCYTTNREKAIVDIINGLPINLTCDTALRIIKIFSYIYGRSQLGTIRNLEKRHGIVSILNYCIASIEHTTGFNFETMWNRYNWGKEKVFVKIAELGLDHEIYRP